MKQADSETFVAYRLEWGAGAPPFEWNLLVRSTDKQPSGTLGEWDVTGLPEGIYTLRLVMEDSARGELSTFILVNVGENIRRSGTPKPTATPTPADP